MKNPVPSLRITAIIEAISYLLLLGVAMPLKYFANMPMAVQIVGWFHGLFFIVFCAALLQTFVLARWPVWRTSLIFLASLVPVVPFFLDHRLKKYSEEFQLKTSVS